MFEENQNPLGFDPEQARKILRSPEAKALLKLLDRDGGAALRQAAEKMKAGDLAGAQAAVAQTMTDPQAQALVEKLNRQQEK